MTVDQSTQVESYRGRYAELYDLIYADKPYSQEAAFVHQCFGELGSGEIRRVLELACGTGSHALALSAYGYQIFALDHSAAMLAVARRKAIASGAKVEFSQQDMRSFEVDGAPFDAAFCLFDSIGYVVADEAIAELLSRVRRHLRPGGLFVFEFWHAPAMLQHYSPIRVRRWPAPHGELLRISETELRSADHVAVVHYSLYELGADGRYGELHETQQNRCFDVAEIQRFLENGNFKVLKWYSGFSLEEPLTDDTWHVICVAQR